MKDFNNTFISTKHLTSKQLTSLYLKYKEVLEKSGCSLKDSKITKFYNRWGYLYVRDSYMSYTDDHFFLSQKCKLKQITEQDLDNYLKEQEGMTKYYSNISDYHNQGYYRVPRNTCNLSLNFEYIFWEGHMRPLTKAEKDSIITNSIMYMLMNKEEDNMSECKYERVSGLSISDVADAIARGDELYIRRSNESYTLILPYVSISLLTYCVNNESIYRKLEEVPWWDKHKGSLVAVRDCEYQNWQYDVFEEYNEWAAYPFQCKYDNWKEIRPLTKAEKDSIITKG